MGITELANRLTSVIVNPAILLIFAVALLVFVWGVMQYLWALNVGGKESNAGKQHMLWGVAGMFIMTAAWGILKLIDSTIGANIVR